VGDSDSCRTSPRADLTSHAGLSASSVTGPGNVTWFSGPTTSATNTRDSGLPYGVWTIRGATDDILLGEHLAYPTPSTASVSAQTSAYDTRTGTASNGHVRLRDAQSCARHRSVRSSNYRAYVRH
jgi:hypothetical protein